jgi:molybdenum cofactor synthesis domain-containing protein
MENKKVLVLPGDGIGKEVCDAAIPVLAALNLPIDLMYGDIGWESWTTGGNPVPQATWDQIDQVDAILLGAITSKAKRQAEQELPPALQGKNHKYVSPVIQLRQRLGLFANVRPSFYIAGNGKPYRMSVIRENTEGLYAGFDYRGVPEPFRPLIQHANLEKYGYDAASCTLRLQTKLGLERLFEFAFAHAVEKGFDKVTFADKPNVMRESGDFAQEIFHDIAARFPGIEADIQNVDAVALWLVTRPEKFGVIVAENMFGDILSDLAGGVMGGLGLAPSANYGERVAYFEPVHGSAPGMVGMNKANPGAMFLSIAMMLEYLGFAEAATTIEDAVREAVRKSANLTYDFGGSAGTDAFASEVIALVKGQRLKKTAAILCIGDELCNGEYQNTNMTDISKHLNALGYKVREHAVCADQRHLIARALSRFVGEYELVVVSGGLGPTSDDVTRFSVADAMMTKLEFRDECWEHIVKRMESFNLQVRDADKVQAYIPVEATVLHNTRGLASGFMLEKHGTTVAVLPGPPQEMKAMLLATFQGEPMTADQGQKFEWKLMGLMETETNVFVNTLDAAFASKVKYLWRYPYLNISVEVAEGDATGLQCVQQLDHFLLQHTVSKDGRSAVELLGAQPEVSWLGDDAELGQLLTSLPGTHGAPQFVVETVPKLSQIGSEQSYTGSLEIICSIPSGKKIKIATPLRGAEVREYVKEFAAWSYLRSTQ